MDHSHRVMDACKWTHVRYFGRESVGKGLNSFRQFSDVPQKNVDDINLHQCVLTVLFQADSTSSESQSAGASFRVFSQRPTSLRRVGSHERLGSRS